MKLDTCTSFGCTHPVAYHAVDNSNRTVAAYCEAHGDAIVESGAGPYTLLRPDLAELSTPQQEDTMADFEAPPLRTELAPPNAVFDEDEEVPFNVLERAVPSTEEASTNFFWRLTGKTNIFDLQTTVRGAPTEEQMTAHIESAIAAMTLVVKLGGTAKSLVQPLMPAPAPTTPKTTPETLSVGNGVPTLAAPALVPPPPVHHGLPYEEPAETGGILHATDLRITHRDDGKIELGFCLNKERKWPDLKLINKPENVIRFLSAVGGWTLEHLRKKGRYDINYDVMWENSERLKGNGTPYQNIVGIAPHVE